MKRSARAESAAQKATAQGHTGRAAAFVRRLTWLATLPGRFRTSWSLARPNWFPAGSDIILQLHYTANGKPATDISKLGLVFRQGARTKRVLSLAATTANFAIPPGDSDYRVEAKIKLQDDATLINLLPHMHFRGKDFTYKVTYPSGENGNPAGSAAL